MRITMLSSCLLVALVWGCRPVEDNSEESKDNSAELARRVDVSWMMEAYWHLGYVFDVNGPYELAEVDKILHADFKERRPIAEAMRAEFVKNHPDRAEEWPIIERYEQCKQGQSWQKLKAKHQEGDELYFFDSPEGFRTGEGVKGYALIRGQQIVHVTWTLKTDGVFDPDRQ